MTEINPRELRFFFISTHLAVTLLLALAIFSLFLWGYRQAAREHANELKREIFRSKCEFIQNAVNRTIQDIEQERRLCASPCDEEALRERLRERIRIIRLENNGYIWINAVLNYEGGDNYAYRFVHPNLPETEGMMLSTGMQDIRGNFPYLTELEGVKKDGELFFDYWFKKMDSDIIQHKLTFARLYKPYDWIIATGVYLDDVDTLMQSGMDSWKRRISRYIPVAASLTGAALLLAFLFFLTAGKRVDSKYAFYLNELDGRRRAEEMAQARLRIMEAAYRDGALVDDILHRMLDEIETLTGSRMGFCHFVAEDQETLTLQCWSRNTLASMCTADGKGRHYPVAEAGVWADCLRERRPVIHNDYASLPGRRGMPKGHPRVIRELVVPVFRKSRVVAIVGVGNKPVEYRAMDMEMASLLADFSWETVSRNLAEEALSVNERKLEDAVRIANVGYWDRDYIAGSITLSEEACRIFGLPLQNRLPGLAEWHSQWLKLIHPEDEPEVAQAITDALAGGPPYNVDYRVVRPDGGVRRIHSYAEVVRDESGKPLRMFGTMIDITERKQAEAEIRKLNLELEQRVTERTAQFEAANKELEAFSYSVAHDLRAPLRHIDGFLELLQQKMARALDERSRHYMDTIAGSARQMGVLIDDLLSFSRMGRHQLAELSVDLGRLTREVIREFEPETGKRMIHWHIFDLPVVKGDPAMLRIVLTNLISNALKFTQTREQARIEIGSMAGKNSETVIFVRDNGVGFDMAYADKLFGVFQRLHPRDEFEGTGIGLASVHRIITRHGGRTWAEGESGTGSVFFFSLPQKYEGDINATP